MIQIPEPALALNDIRILGSGRIRMSRNIRIHKSDKREHIIDCVANYVKSLPNQYLKSLVINCHGVPGYLLMGEGFWAPHTALFRRWEGLIGNIWILACDIAARTPFLQPGQELPKQYPGTPSDGYVFCQSIAMNARSYVVAGIHTQRTPKKSLIPDGSIDSFEGTTLCFSPKGAMSWARRYDLQTRE